MHNRTCSSGRGALTLLRLTSDLHAYLFFGLVLSWTFLV
jgi:hypothetical protein